MATPNYDIDYKDSRFTKVESEKSAALNEVEKTYGGMISEADKYYQAQIDASKQWADKQTQLQQQQTNFAIQEINQQKEQAKKDYTKEQSGAYVDWQKQSNQYGANAEQVASQGLANTGFSESSQVSMYNTYQNRVATARESYNRTIMNFNNSIQEAKLQNNSILAEIAFEAQKEQLELSLQGFQYKNQLISTLADKKTEVNNTYYARYQDVLQQINHENALAEEVRQYNESLAEEKRQYNATMEEEKRQYNATMSLQQQELQLQKDQFAWQKAQAAAKSSGSSSSKSSGSSSGGSSYKSTKSGNSENSGGSSKKVTSSKNKTKTVNRVAKDNPAPAKTNATMQSILALGYGPISASKLDSLVASGIVEEYKDSKGNTKFRKSASTNKAARMAQLFGR